MQTWLAVVLVSAFVCKMLTDLGLAWIDRMYGPKRGPNGKFTR